MGGDSYQLARRSGHRRDEFARYMQGASRLTARGQAALLANGDLMGPFRKCFSLTVLVLKLSSAA